MFLLHEVLPITFPSSLLKLNLLQCSMKRDAKPHPRLSQENLKISGKVVPKCDMRS